MIEQSIRLYYQKYLVNPLARLLQHYIQPLYITFLAAMTGVIVIPAMYYHFYSFAIFLLLLSGYLDTLDGTIARYANKTSEFGSVCDIMADRVVEFTAIFGLWLVDPTTRSFLCILMLGSILLCITSFLVVGIFTPNESIKSFHYSAGIIERAEAFIFFILMIMMPTYFTILSSIFILLVCITTFIRLYEFHQLSSSS